MNYINSENMNQTVRMGEDQLILFYKKNHAASTILLDSFRSVDSLIGKNFSCYLVDADMEPAVLDAFGVNAVPEIIAMKGTKIYKRSNNLLAANQILNLFK